MVFAFISIKLRGTKKGENLVVKHPDNPSYFKLLVLEYITY